MESYISKGKEKATDDALFLERLEMLFEQSLTDMRAFAERECRPFDEVRRRMAELHSKYLFDRPGPATPTRDRKELNRSVLLTISQQLESLETLAGLQSFFLVVDPNDPEEEGFLGGTVLGREFWRGHRGCGSPGAQMFKAQCIRSAQHCPRNGIHAPPPAIDPALLPAPTTPAAVGTKGSARELKAELYAAMRDALRAASGVRTAEMKWTNHSKLSVYGVRLVGWPEGVPLQNPSTLSVAQNKQLLEMLATGQISFQRLDGARTPDTSQGDAARSPRRDEEEMFEDTIDYSWANEGDDSHILPPHDSTEPCPPERPAWSPAAGAEQAGPTTPTKKRRVDDT